MATATARATTVAPATMRRWCGQPLTTGLVPSFAVATTVMVASGVVTAAPGVATGAVAGTAGGSASRPVRSLL